MAFTVGVAEDIATGARLQASKRRTKHMPDRILCFVGIDFFIMYLSMNALLMDNTPEEEGGRMSTSSYVSNCSIVPRWGRHLKYCIMT